MRTSDLFLSAQELKHLTGQNLARDQAAWLKGQGLTPFINEQTGQCIIYREVILKFQGLREDGHNGDSFDMNLGALDA